MIETRQHQQQFDSLRSVLYELHLCEHGFAILGHHGALIAVKGHKITVEGFLWML